MIERFTLICLVILSFAAEPAHAQNEISTHSFDSIPGQASVLGGGSAIELQADTAVAGSIEATGVVAAGSGVRFPDGTVQLTAAGGTTANSGLYSNTIAEITPPNAYTEICIKSGSITFDIHLAMESTSGGNCVPGDLGWIVERFERDSGGTASWANAKLECLKDGLRLPEPFEWQVTCNNASDFAVNDMEDEWEWGSNAASGDNNSTGGFGFALALGAGSCTHVGQGGIGKGSDGGFSLYEYRCVR